MQREYTSKLFYGKYAYKISMFHRGKVVDATNGIGWTIHKCKNWLTESKIDYRMYSQARLKGKGRREVHVKSSLFLANKASFDACMLQFEDIVTHVVSPYDDSHIDVLKDNTTIVVRKNLLYNRFKFVVIFKREWTDIHIPKITQWVSENLLNGMPLDKDVKWNEHGFNPRLYLNDASDLMLVKLTWGDRISTITVVLTHSELEQR